MFSTATTLAMRTKKELAGGTDGFQAREVQQDTPASHKVQIGRKLLGTWGKDGVGGIRTGICNSKVENTQPDLLLTGNGLRLEESLCGALCWPLIQEHFPQHCLVGTESQCEPRDEFQQGWWVSNLLAMPICLPQTKRIN